MVVTREAFGEYDRLAGPIRLLVLMLLAVRCVPPVEK